MSKIRISDLAKDLGISTQSIYRTIKRLGTKIDGHVLSDHGAKVVDDEGQQLIREVLNCSTILPTSIIPSTIPQDSTRLESLEKGVLALVETFKKEVSNLRADNEALRAEMSSLRLRLEAPPQEPQNPATPRTDPSLVVFRKVEEKPVQRDAVSAWEGIRLAFDDILGFAFGRG